MLSPDNLWLVLVPIAVLLFIVLVRRPIVAFAGWLFGYSLEGGETIPFVVDLPVFLFGTTLIGVFGPLAYHRRWLAFRPAAADGLLLLFSLVMLSSITVAPDVVPALVKVVRFGAIVVASYVVARLIITDELALRRLFQAILFISVGVGIAFLVYLVATGQFGKRVGFLGANPIPNSLLFAIGLMIALAEVLDAPLWRSLRMRMSAAAAVPLLFIALFATGSRGPIIFVAVTFGLYLGWSILSDPNRKEQIAKAASALVLAVVLVSVSSLGLPNLWRFGLLVQGGGRNVEGRLERYEVALDLFKDHLWLGVGADGFRQLADGRYPHNVALEVAVETGLIGLVCFLAFFLMVARSGFRFLSQMSVSRLSRPMQSIGMLTIALFLLVLLEKQVSGSVGVAKHLFVWAALIVNLPGLANTDEPSEAT